MKIIHITTVDLSLRFLVFDFLKYLAAKNYSVVGVCAPGKYVPEVEQAGIPVITVRMTRRITPLTDLLALFQLIRVLHQEKPNIVHTHTPKANLLGQLAAMLIAVPVRIATVHGLYFTPRSPLIKRLFFRTVEYCSACFAQVVFLVNHDDVQAALDLNICRPEQVRLLIGGLGVDLNRFDLALISSSILTEMRQTFHLPANSIVIGFVGRLVREKGVLDLLAAFQQAQLVNERLRLLVVGPYDDDKSDAITSDAASRYDIADKCIFTGMRSDTEYLYGLMDIFVLPSYREGSPLCLMEAQAMGLPVVTTDARGCREAILPNVTGCIVPVGDTAALMQAILKLARDPELRHKMGAAGRQLAKTRFDQQIAFESIDQEYARLLDYHVKPTRRSNVIT